MRIALLGMHRSGTNVIGRWLLRQQRNRINLKFEGITDWLEWDEKEDACFASQVNHPEHLEWEGFGMRSQVATIEREGMDYFGDFCHEHGYTWNGAALVIRDFRNWLASVYKMNGGKVIPNIDIEKYKSHLDAIKAGHHWFTPIVYNLWCKSKAYRQEIAIKLCGFFNDEGYDNVPHNGGGSSFDGRWFDGAGSKMKTDQRYKDFESDSLFRHMLRKYSDIIKESDEWLMRME